MPNAASASRSRAGRSAITAPTSHAAANRAAVLPWMTSRYWSSVVVRSFCVCNCSTSPSAIVAAARDRMLNTTSEPSSTINWNARANRKSPTSTDALLPKIALAEARPRRNWLSSTTSSCNSVAVWMNSTQAARSTWRAPSSGPPVGPG